MNKTSSEKGCSYIVLEMIKKYKRILGVLIPLKNLMKRIIYKLPKLCEKITLNPTRSITIENIGKL